MIIYFARDDDRSICPSELKVGAGYQHYARLSTFCDILHQRTKKGAIV
jgi:hypothetical protein